MRHRSQSFILLLCILAIYGIWGCNKKFEEINLRESDMPWQTLCVLTEGDAVAITLPDSRQIRWVAERDALSLGREQAAACGLKMCLQEPVSMQLKNYKVESSQKYDVSVYTFVVGGYRVDRAVDLRAESSLPVIIAIFRTGEGFLDHSTARGTFDNIGLSQLKELHRVPIGVVHRGLMRELSLPIKLLVSPDSICFKVSGDVWALGEADRLALVRTLMDYVIKRYDRIEEVEVLHFELLKEENVMFRYEVSRDEAKNWQLIPQ